MRACITPYNHLRVGSKEHKGTLAHSPFWVAPEEQTKQKRFGQHISHIRISAPFWNNIWSTHFVPYNTIPTNIELIIPRSIWKNKWGTHFTHFLMQNPNNNRSPSFPWTSELCNPGIGVQKFTQGSGSSSLTRRDWHALLPGGALEASDFAPGLLNWREDHVSR